MLSYSWSSQRTVLSIRDRLEAAGLRVWVDVDQMGANLIDSMADAVERSTVIVVCCSSAYKASPNCRREADYASHLNKPMVVANMESGFVPRGWLGLHVAGKIWCDFREESPDCFNRGMSTLMRQLAEAGVSHAARAAASVARPAAVVAVPTPLAASPPPPPRATVALVPVPSLAAAAGAAATPVVASPPAVLPPSRAPTPAPPIPMVSPLAQLPAPPASSSPAVVPAPPMAPSAALRDPPLPLAMPLDDGLAQVAEAPVAVAVPHRIAGSNTAERLMATLLRGGHPGLAARLSDLHVTALAIDGLAVLKRGDPRAFYDIVMAGLGCDFMDALALFAALPPTSADAAAGAAAGGSGGGGSGGRLSIHASASSSALMSSLGSPAGGYSSGRGNKS